MTAPPIRILFVAYFYPPATVGVRRLLSLLRHLPADRFDCHVLTVKPTAGEGCDPGPLAQLQQRVRTVERAGSLDPYRLLRIVRGEASSTSGGVAATAARPTDAGKKRAMQWMRRYLFVPDDRAGWLPFAVWRAWRMIRRHRIDVVYSSNYPQTTHLAAGLAARLAGVPWLADFRDGWTQNPAFHVPGTAAHDRMQHALERWVAKSAARIVTVSPPITAHLQSLRPPALAPAETIYNGFEGTSLPGCDAEAPAPLDARRRTLLYTGTFFGVRRPEPFLEGLVQALRDDPSLPERWRVLLRTELDAPARERLAALPLGGIVSVEPPIPHAEALEEQRRADGLLLVLEHGPGSDIMVSQKIFEYLAARRPVFALIPAGACEALLADTGGAIVCTGLSPREIAPRLREFFSTIEDGTRSLASLESLQRYTREAQAKRFAELFESMIRKPEDTHQWPK